MVTMRSCAYVENRLCSQPVALAFQWVVLGICSQSLVSYSFPIAGDNSQLGDRKGASELTSSMVANLKHHNFVDSESSVDDYWSLGVHILPTFDNSTARNVTTQLGQTAYLHCIVINLGDKMVSWIRRKDFHVLTVGLETYTSDDRFQSIHMEQTNDWALQIKFAQLKDAGMYECQVSSDPKISYFVNLTVVVAKAAIEEAPDIYVKTGSSINLTCVISQSPEPPVFVFWYHDDRMINYDSSRGQITVHKEKGDTALSRLYIKDAQTSDSGNYTCCPSNAEATSTTVHVLNGEKPAAMQHDGNPLASAGERHCYILSLQCSTLSLVMWTVLRRPITDFFGREWYEWA